MSNTFQFSVVFFKKLHPDAVIPTKATAGSAGYDLYAVEDGMIPPGVTQVVPTGLAVEIPQGMEMQIRSRSSLAVRGVAVANAPGTVDSDYRGEVGVILRNNGGQFFHYKKGDRIAQVVMAMYQSPIFEETQELTQTERADGGFGSTGA